MEAQEGFDEWREIEASDQMYLQFERSYRDLVSQLANVRRSEPDDIAASRRELQEWMPLLSSLAESEEDAFSHSERVTCNAFSGDTKYVTLQLSRSDRTSSRIPSSQGQEGPQATDTIVTVRCPSRFSVSIGGVVSFVETKEYDIRSSNEASTSEEGDSGASVVNRPVLTGESGIKQSPVVMVTGRVHSGGIIQFHIAVGTVINIGSTEENTDVVRLLGGIVGCRNYAWSVHQR